MGESPVWRPAEGALYWVDIPARRVHRLIVESGRADTWRAPEMVACIAFGGANLDTMYVTTIRPQKESDLAGQPLAGAVFAFKPGAQGLPETEFSSQSGGCTNVNFIS